MRLPRSSTPPRTSHSSVLRRFSLAVCALVVGLTGAIVTGALPAQAAPVSDFHADSGDRCGYGATRGSFDWNPITLGILPAVAVKGVVVDKPIAYDALPCSDDLMYSVVTFTGYTAGVVVAGARAKADNSSEDMRILLTGRRVIDTVVVQVCRYSTVPTFAPVDYCGLPVRYARPRA